MALRPYAIYLAGPDVFLPDALERAAGLKAICERYGAEGLFPLDNVIKGLVGRELAAAIRTANMDLIFRCDAVVANMEPFRGPSMDTGTAYEMGAAAALGKPVVGYTKDTRDYLTRVRAMMPVTMCENGEWRDAQGMLVEDFGLVDNLMMDCGAAAIFDSAEEAVAEVVEILARRQATGPVLAVNPGAA